MLTKEELKDKFIRYTPEITEEMFNKIVCKLKEYFGESNRIGTPLDYENFKKNWNYIQIFSRNSFNWSLDNNSQNNTEIQISDILGKDWNKSKEWWEDLKKGDYFVVTKSCKRFNGELNHIYKAKQDGYFFSKENFRIPYEGSNGSTIGLPHIDIRPANSDEIKLYKHAGKPVDVTTYRILEEDIEALLEEAKKRFPIGCTFRAICNDGTIGSEYEQNRECCLFEDNGEIWIIGSANIRHPNGTWAEIVSMPDTKKLKLEVGKWYTYIELPNSLICCQDASEGYGYGIWIEGWDSSPTAYLIGTTSEWKELSDKEVTERLIKYAKEHYPVGTMFKSALKSDQLYLVETNDYYMWRGLTGVVVNGSNGASIYHEGKWAEIISKPEVKSEEPPCKVGDYIYIIDVTKGGENPHKEAYGGDIIEITDIYKEENNSKYGGWWINHKPASFSGGGFRLGGNGYQWNEHVRLATPYEIEQAKSGWKVAKIKDFSDVVKQYPLIEGWKVKINGNSHTWAINLFKSEEKVENKPKLKLKNKSKIKISKKQVKVSNKHLI